MSGAPIHKKVESPWRDRLSALRNLPPVLRILWDSGPAVVTWGLVIRAIVATLPIAIAKVAALILQDIADVLRGSSLPHDFWMLVGIEVGLNIVFGLLMHAMDYSDLSL